MSETVTSRLAGFHKLGLPERLSQISRMFKLDPDEAALLNGEGALAPHIANQMIENAVGTFSLPLGLGLNLKVNGRDFIVPMAVEEPSVVAAVSFAAKIVREAGGFTAEADDSMMIGQVQVTRYGDPEEASRKILAAKDQILALANSFHPQMVRRGGGAKDVEVRVLPAPEGPRGEPLLIVHLLIDTQDAMGANLINTVAEGISQASRFAQADPYRAATHNKGVMNGVDAVAIATGQDWRAIEAGAHAFAARDGQYRPLSSWHLEEGHLVGRIELPLALGLVGGPIKVHAGVQLALKILRVSSVREMSMVFAAVGLAQNFAALRALGSVGIQKGHMALHARCVAVTAGARGDWVEKIANLLVTAGHVKVEKAREILASLTPEEAAAATGNVL